MVTKHLTGQTLQPKRGGSKKGRAYRRPALDTLPGLLAETLRVYRSMKAGQLDIDKGRALVWVLMGARTMLEAMALERIEAKLDRLSEAAQAQAPQRGLLTYDGDESTAGEARSTH